MRSFSIVVAADRAMGIGKNRGLPWRLRKDMAFFAKITSKVVQGAQDATTIGELTHQRRVNACIMGRKTWESIPKKFRPLTDRFNVIVSRDPHYLDDKPEKGNPLVALATSFEAALDLVESLQSPSSSSPSTSSIQVARTFLIGGAQLYNEGVRSKDCTHIFLTRIDATVDCDTFFPEISPSEYQLLPSTESHEFLENYLQESVEGGVIEEGSYQYEYTVYNRI
ncbi:hypothetical protein K457DRAFT_96161 [Linnemannia elongata AG-77]|uniref:Dihydrofolate reductase n=1 Tax=Linnemannia elongata AG-77 TaxID=1314771 RepID=A0A197JVT6_9FUNG|nr:hypothetical protein K457DRAFT_96161 [Linnemannia elongata AG-77]